LFPGHPKASLASPSQWTLRWVLGMMSRQRILQLGIRRRDKDSDGRAAEINNVV